MTQLIVGSTLAELAQQAASWLDLEVSRAIAEQGSCALGLAGGRTPEPVYRQLASGSSANWEKVDVFLRRRARRSARSSRQQLSHGTPGLALSGSDPVQQCPPHAGRACRPRHRRPGVRAFASAPARRPGAGHGRGRPHGVALPGSAALEERQRLVVPVLGAKAPAERLTITPPVIEAARKVAVIAAGEDKALMVARAIEGPFAPRAVPVQLAQRGCWFLDRGRARHGSRPGRWQHDSARRRRGWHQRATRYCRPEWIQRPDRTGDRYPSRDYPGLTPIVHRFSEDVANHPERACFGVACPVVGDDCTAPNLPWRINARKLAAEIGIPRTTIINDFVAAGYGIEMLGRPDLATIQEGSSIPHGPIALIGPGTGFGSGISAMGWRSLSGAAIRGRTRRLCPARQATERPAGVPARAIRSGLLGAAALGRRTGQQSIAIFSLPESRRSRRPCGPRLEREDPAAVITRHGLARTDGLSDRALDLFCEYSAPRRETWRSR